MKATVGEIITRNDGHRFRLTGTINGDWLAEDLDGPFASPVVLTLAELVTGFDVDEVATPETEYAMMHRLDREANEHNLRYIERGAKPRKEPVLPADGTPEYQFIEAEARAIFDDAERLAAYEIGELAVSAAIEVLLGKWIKERNQSKPAERPKRTRARSRS